MRPACPLDWLSSCDRSLCVRINRLSRRACVRQVFRAASRLGDGLVWYGLMLFMLLVSGVRSAPAVAHMIVTGLACTLLYKWLKRRTLRPRPYEVHPDIVAWAAPLDRFSFPSGHTLHAVAFSMVAAAYQPSLTWLLLPLAALIALSRVVLGLHYPSDVIIGGLIGAAVAAASLALRGVL
jgi:undecaprenyl-diphosphatase